MTTIILLLALFAILGTFAYAGMSAAPWLPMRKYEIERFCEFADMQPGMKLYDLGCGDGRIVCAAAKRGVRAVGFEISLLPYFLAKVRCLLSGIPASSIRYQNLWTADISDADAVYFYLLPEMYPKLKKKMEKELKPGTRVMTYAWAVEDWQPIKVDDQQSKLKLFVYQMQDKKDG